MTSQFFFHFQAPPLAKSWLRSWWQHVLWQFATICVLCKFTQYFYQQFVVVVNESALQSIDLSYFFVKKDQKS